MVKPDYVAFTVVKLISIQIRAMDGNLSRVSCYSLYFQSLLTYVCELDTKEYVR